MDILVLFTIYPIASATIIPAGSEPMNGLTPIAYDTTRPGKMECPIASPMNAMSLLMTNAPRSGHIIPTSMHTIRALIMKSYWNGAIKNSGVMVMMSQLMPGKHFAMRTIKFSKDFVGKYRFRLPVCANMPVDAENFVKPI